MTSDPLKIAYAAGLLDGEGSIYSESRPSGMPGLMISVQMANAPVVEWLRENFGGRTYVVTRKERPMLPSGERAQSYRQQYLWRIHATVVEEFLRLVIPYLIVKRQQAEIALSIRSLSKNRLKIPSRLEAANEFARQIKVLNRTGTL